MTPTPNTAEALAAQLDRPHWTGLPIELHVEAAAMLRSQAQEIESLRILMSALVNEGHRVAKERDDYQRWADNSASEHKEEVDRLHSALAALVDPAGYTIGYPSSSLEAKGARTALEAV